MDTQLLEEVIRDLKKGLQPPNKNFTFELLPIDNYELVLKITNKKACLNAIVAIHNLALGPALGGTRIFPYSSFNQALTDVLRLAKGMTYKAALAEVGIGGGKSVIIANPKTDKTEVLLEAFGEAIDAFQGKYICAEDVGCTPEDMKIIRRKTKYAVGLPHEKSSGNPAVYTAWGTFRGIQATAKKLFGSTNLEGKKIAVQGLGSVSHFLMDFLFWAGAELILTDINQEKTQKYAKIYGASYVKPDQIYQVECDIFVPCALGGILNDQIIPSLRCKGICGCANNQLLKDSDAEILRMRDILYAPDYVINAGGLLNVVAEIRKEGYAPKHPRKKTNQIYDTLLGIYEIAEKNNMSTVHAANALAEYRIQYGIGKRQRAPVFHHTVT